MSLLEKWMPLSDIAARYGTAIRAPAPLVYETLLSLEFGRLPIVRMLMLLRAIPAFIASPRATLRRMHTTTAAPTLRLKSVLSNDFALLDEAVGDEIVMGLTGRFWTPSGTLVPTSAATFHEPAPPGMAKAAWNFQVVPQPDGSTTLTTETRVRCSDPATTRRFLRYWRLVAPGSGLIRWAILRAVRVRAEHASRG